MPDGLEKLLSLLQPQATGELSFRGIPDRPEAGRVYGGTVLAQAMWAAMQTVAGERAVHSQHAYFLRAGDPSQPIDYEVDPIRDGGSFSTRRVVARQNGRAILNTALSFQTEESGFEHQEPMPPAPPPDELFEREDLMRQIKQDWPSARLPSHAPGICFAPVEPVRSLRPPPRQARQLVWMRSRGDMPPERNLHRVLLAYMSDSYLLSSALLPHGRSVFDQQMICASLDHALWFHAAPVCDEWLLYAMASPAASGGRGLARGSIYRRDGTLVASTAQEALLRSRRED